MLFNDVYIELKDLVLTTPLYLNARYVNVINHYIYTSDNDRTTLYRINPANGNLELAI